MPPPKLYSAPIRPVPQVDKSAEATSAYIAAKSGATSAMCAGRRSVGCGHKVDERRSK
jgi:hypothetical protein